MPPRLPEQPDQGPAGHEVELAGFNAIREIDQSDESHDKALVAAFLCAAWPSLQAQNQ